MGSRLRHLSALYWLQIGSSLSRRRADGWRSIGGQIWLDPTIGLQHVGTRVYEGDPMTLIAPAVADAAA